MRVSLPRRSDSVAGVTAVIPCYNYARYLPQAVDSVLSQEGVAARVIIVDDSSTDDSLDVAYALAEADPRITVVAHATNAGHIATYNDGLAAVTTEYVTLLSADDMLAPGALGRAVSLMNIYSDVGMVYGQPIEFTGTPPQVDRDGHAPHTWTVWPGSQWIRLTCLRGKSFILSPEVVMRAEAMREIGGYNSALPKSGDLEYWLRTAYRWKVGRINGRVQAFYRQHDNNMHSIEFATMSADITHRLLAFRYLESTELPGNFLRACRRALAREAISLASRELDSGGRADVAGDLLETAVDIRPALSTARRVRRFRRRLVRAADGAPPTPLQRGRESIRLLRDRIRWRLWVYTGVS